MGRAGKPSGSLTLSVVQIFVAMEEIALERYSDVADFR
jgi:hypothetical protein